MNRFCNRIRNHEWGQAVTTFLDVAFWVSAALIVWTQVGYGLALRLVVSMMATTPSSDAAGASKAAPAGSGHDVRPADAVAALEAPLVSLIVAAHNEEGVIAAKVANAQALAYPPGRTEIIVACDGCSDQTAQRARDAGADLVLELPRGGKVRAQDAAVARARGTLMAFSDANATWDRYALRALVAAFDDPHVGYVCGQVSFTKPTDAAGATSQENVYWRYELGLRALESRVGSITAGNGAIYATRRDSYMVVDPVMGHDLSFPFNMVKRGWRAVYVPTAVANEKMVPSIEGEFARKRRMMSHTWPILLRGGLLSPRGYGPVYWVMISSHRTLRYATPLLHLVALGSSVLLVAAGAGPVIVAALWLQGAVLIAAALGGAAPWRPLLIARHYVLTVTAVAAGLWDWLRHGTSASWQVAEGTR
jgi:cellulose synthase/poly-beta-1,6-N-acetylglucosamine synthase-like glycosyltransferase